MEPDRAIEIVQALVGEANPHSSECFPARPPYRLSAYRHGSGTASSDWVMKGSMNAPNYVLSGKYQPQSWPGNNIPAPFSSGQEFTVPARALHTPEGLLGPVKGLLGQRIYNP